MIRHVMDFVWTKSFFSVLLNMKWCYHNLLTYIWNCDIGLVPFTCLYSYLDQVTMCWIIIEYFFKCAIQTTYLKRTYICTRYIVCLSVIYCRQIFLQNKLKNIDPNAHHSNSHQLKSYFSNLCRSTIALL